MQTERRKYSLAFKTKAVELSHQRGSVATVAQELGIAIDNLKRWKKEYTKGKLLEKPVVKQSPEAIELFRLQKELREVTLERDILKKAVGIFSKSDW